MRARGYSIGVTCRRVAVTSESDPLLLGRVEIKGASLGEFVVQVVRGLRRAGSAQESVTTKPAAASTGSPCVSMGSAAGAS